MADESQSLNRTHQPVNDTQLKHITIYSTWAEILAELERIQTELVELKEAQR